jgi:hypothetical protein
MAVSWLKQLVTGFPTQQPGLKPMSGYVRFVVDEAALGQVFFKYFSFPCRSIHRLLHTHHHLSSGAGTIGHIEAKIPRGLRNTPPQELQAYI